MTANVVLFVEVLGAVRRAEGARPALCRGPRRDHGRDRRRRRPAFAALPDEKAVLTDVCRAGGEVVTASADDIAALRAAVTPVWDAIAADAAAAPVLRAVRAAVGTAPMDVAADAAGCPSGGTAAPGTTADTTAGDR